MTSRRHPPWSKFAALTVGLLLITGTAWGQVTTPPPPPGEPRTPTPPVLIPPGPPGRPTGPTRPVPVPPRETEEKQVIIAGTVSAVDAGGCPTTGEIPSFQVQILGGALTLGIGSDDATVVHDRSETSVATGSDAIVETGQFVEVAGSVASDGTCVIADRIVIRSRGYLVVRGPVTSLVGSQVVVRGATFDIESDTKIFGPRGTPGTLADLSVGTGVRVGGPRKPGGTYQAKRVHIGAEFLAEGSITNVGSGGSSITVAGRVITLPSDVQIFQRSENHAPEETARGVGEARPVLGGQAGDVNLLQVGTVVAVFGQTSEDATPTYTADRIYVFAGRRVTFEGTVSGLSGRRFSLDILAGVSIPVNAARARVRGQLADGATAVVIGTVNATGGIDANSVVVKSRVQFVPRGRGPETPPPGRGPSGPGSPGGPGRGPGEEDRGRGPGDRR